MGYGGTQEEMKRLIADASKLDKSINANDMSFANIVKSINAVQREMGIYGTTAKEANQTISGSIAAVKAQWENLLTAVAGDFDIGVYVENFVSTIKTAASNILPVVQQALNGVVTLIEFLLPEIIGFLPSLIQDTLPKIATAAVNIVKALVDGISKNQKVLIDSAFEVIMTLADGIMDMLPEILQLGLELIISLANGITESLPELIPALIETILQIVETLTNPDTLSQLLSAALEMVMALAMGLVENIDEIIDAVFVLIENLVEFLLRPSTLGMLIETAVKLVVALGMGLIKAKGKLLESVWSLIKNIFTAFGQINWSELGSNIIQGIRNGISKMWNNLKEWFKSLFGDLIGIAKKILGIKSPSKVFEKFGIFVDEGLQIGLERGARDVLKTVEGLSNDVASSFNPDLTADYTVSYNRNGSGNSSRFDTFNGYNNGANKTEVVVSIDDSISPLSFARYLLPYLKVAQKEAFA